MTDGLIETALAKSTEAALAPAKSFLERLLGPMADEVGLLLQDKVRGYRFKNHLRLLAKTQKMLDDAEVKPRRVNMKVLMPLLEGVADEDDELMFNRWAALLANAALPQPKVHPSFARILSELTPREAVVLEWFYDNREHEEAGDIKKEKIKEMFVLTDATFAVIADNLVRLELCYGITDRERNVIWDENYDSSKMITDLGVAFVEACRKPPRKKPMREVRTHNLGGRFDDLDIRAEAYE